MVEFKKGDKVGMRNTPSDWDEPNIILGSYFAYDHGLGSDEEQPGGTDCTLLLIYIDRSGDLETTYWDVSSKQVGLYHERSGKHNFRFNKGAV